MFKNNYGKRLCVCECKVQPVLKYSEICRKLFFREKFCFMGEAAKFAHLLQSASLKKNYMTKNYEKIFIE